MSFHERIEQNVDIPLPSKHFPMNWTIFVSIRNGVRMKSGALRILPVKPGFVSNVVARTTTKMPMNKTMKKEPSKDGVIVMTSRLKVMKKMYMR